jgi:hypothetical protein
MDEKYFHDESWNQLRLIRIRCQILQKITVVEIKHVFVPRNIIEHFRQFIPEAQLINLPGMAPQVPDSAIFQEAIEERLAKTNPAILEAESGNVVI